MTIMEKIMAGIFLPFIFCVVGGYFANYGFDYFKTKRVKKRKCLAQTKGKIVNISSASGSKNLRRTYFPIYEYTVNNKPITIEINFGTTSCQYNIGDEIKIWYDKNNPKFSYIDGYRQESISAIVSFVLGTITIICGLIAAVFVWFV